MKIATAEGELLVSETFGPTVQGEGPSLGQRAVFIRLMGCNLTCPSCDTPYTWDAARFDLGREGRRVAVEELISWALGTAVDLVVITGGEPLLQQRGLLPLAAGLAAAGRRVELETNGTIAPLPQLIQAVTQFNVSPKLTAFGAGMPQLRRIRGAVLRRFAASGRAVFKFVVSSPRELAEVHGLARAHGLAPVWVMPEGTTAAAITDRLGELAGPAIECGFHVTTRLHVLAWGDERGR
jgi:organic radical activating enzyme